MKKPNKAKKQLNQPAQPMCAMAVEPTPEEKAYRKGYQVADAEAAKEVAARRIDFSRSLGRVLSRIGMELESI